MLGHRSEDSAMRLRRSEGASIGSGSQAYSQYSQGIEYSSDPAGDHE